MTTATISKDIAVKAFNPEFIEFVGTKQYEATFELKNVPADVKARLEKLAVERVEQNINFCEKFDGMTPVGLTNAEYAKQMRANASKAVVERYNQLEWSYKYDNKIEMPFVAPSKDAAEKIARVYAREVLSEYRLRWVYVKR
jgi:hypothetical protein